MAKQPTGGRTRRGAETRQRIEDAAGKLFTERGYHATSMQEIAAAAGVHVQTIYLAYGTKAELLRAAASRPVAEGEDPEVPPAERRWVREIVQATDPRQKIRLYVRHIHHLTVGWGPYQQAMRAASDEPEVAERLAAMEEGRHQGPRNLWPMIFEAGDGREGLTVERAADLTFAIASPDTFRQLMDRGWTGDQAEEAIADVLIRSLLRD